MMDLSHFQFDQNPLWDDIQKRLKDMIEVEMSEAIGQDISPEVRSHQCGRAEALADFKHSLLETWEKANSR
tara:strand:- start:1263 stop:1475 length:213 start_codon:yes stop_codon:yes gene_type:complete